MRLEMIGTLHAQAIDQCLPRRKNLRVLCPRLLQQAPHERPAGRAVLLLIDGIDHPCRLLRQYGVRIELNDTRLDALDARLPGQRFFARCHCDRAPCGRLSDAGLTRTYLAVPALEHIDETFKRLLLIISHHDLPLIDDERKVVAVLGRTL